MKKNFDQNVVFHLVFHREGSVLRVVEVNFQFQGKLACAKKDAPLMCCCCMRFTAGYRLVDQILKFQMCRGLSRVALKDMSKIVKSWSRYTKSVNVIKTSER